MADVRDIVRRDADALSEVMKLRFNPLIAERARGSSLWDPDGREYLDFSAGWGVANIGYAHPRLLERTARQQSRLGFLSTISMINEESVALAERLKSLVPGGDGMKVWYGHSGSDANEFIAKIVPMATGRPRILTFTGSYHGQTMGAYGMSGHPAQSRFIAGAGVLKAPYPYCRRCPFGRSKESCGMFCIDYIRDFVLSDMAPAEQVSAVVIEAVQCDGGDVVPPDGFLRGLREICDDRGILLVLDEVKIGFGRTGRFFGFEWDGIVPDAVVMGKPMGGGHPLSAVVGRADIMDAGTGLHLFTTAGNPLACAASLVTIDIIKDEGLEERAGLLGRALSDGLAALKNKYGCIGDVRGRGLVIGVEIVDAGGCVASDSAQDAGGSVRAPAPDGRLAALIAWRAFELGLIFYCTGNKSNVLELTPPLVLTDVEAERALGIMGAAIDDAIGGRVDEAAALSYAGWGT
jgi:4-aminobutyrate aminotransferase